MKSLKSRETAKPVIMLVHQPSPARLWMKKRLRRFFDVIPFSGADRAIAFVHSAESIDVLISDLDISLPPLGGCNIARDVRHRFPKSLIYVFTNQTSEDHRIVMLRTMNNVHFLSKPFGIFLSAHKIMEALEKGKIA